MWKRVLPVALAIGVIPGAARSPLGREPIVAGVRIYHGPGPGLGAVDESLIGRATRRLDMAAYVLTDHAIIGALEAAARRGVRLRLYLDPEQNGARDTAPGGRLGELLRLPGVEARAKNPAGDLMHLKSYQVDGRWLRTGSANFSLSGEQRQDNDIVVIESVDAAGAFAADFERLWARRDNGRFAP